MSYTITIILLNLYNQLGSKRFNVSRYPWEIFNPRSKFLTVSCFLNHSNLIVSWMYNTTSEKKKRSIKRQHSLTLAQWNRDFLGISLFCPQLRKETPWTLLIQSIKIKPHKKSKISQGNILTFIEGTNEDIFRKHSKESSKW